MKISELAQRTGVSVHRLRRYEAAGLLQAERGASGYREFGDASVREVTFIAMGRDLGFSLDALAEAIPRYRAGQLTLAQMVEFMQGRIGEVDTQLRELRALRKRLLAHIAWLNNRQHALKDRKRSSTPPPKAWPGHRKTSP